MEEKIDVIFGIIIVIICVGLFFFGLRLGYHKNKSKTIENVIIYDTTYNKVILDSIEYNIIKKDSIIKHIKYEMQHEIKKVDAIDDSTAVKLFKQLCTD